MKNKISYKNRAKVVVEDDQTRYIYKIKKRDKSSLYQYLKSKDFLNFLPCEKTTNEYEIYRYLNDEITSKDDKAIELIYTLSMLHIKTTTYQEIDIDEVKKLYEETKTKINYLRGYYFDLQDYIETKIYMSPAEYLLMKNISKFYKALNFAEQKLDSWYQEKSKQKNERLVQLHNNLTLDHFIKDKNPYLISWDNSKKGPVIFDFLNFYKNEYLNLEMISLFEIYQTKYRFSKEEFLLFESLLAIPDKITFTKTNYINTLEAKKKITYIEKTNEFLSKYNEKNQKSNNEELKQ